MRNNIEELMNRILHDKGTDKFYLFVNSSGKKWLLSSRNKRVAISIYQPGSFKGKLLKCLFPYLHILPFLDRLGLFNIVYRDIDEGFREFICQNFEIKNPEFSIFYGTPSANRKVTIQISEGKRILGYCKVSNDERIAKLFFNEQKILSDLHSKGIDNIPKCLYCGLFNGLDYAFAQSTCRTLKSQASNHFTKSHKDFLQKLRDTTLCHCDWNESDFATTLLYLNEHIEAIRIEDRECIVKALHSIDAYYGGSDVEFSMYHGDFTPWNTFLNNGSLFVFDFEYARFTCPPYMDACHFISETSRLELKLSPQKAYRYLSSNLQESFPEHKALDILYLGYFLYTLSFYIHLGNGTFDTNDPGYSYWVEQIKIILAETKSQKICK